MIQILIGKDYKKHLPILCCKVRGKVVYDLNDILFDQASHHSGMLARYLA